MCWCILKRDLRRQKGMNLILLLFIVLASLFVSSSVSNILAVTGAIDGYFQKAGMPDLLVSASQREGDPALEDILSDAGGVAAYRTQPILYVTKDNLLRDGQSLKEMNGSGAIYGFENVPLTLFDEENQPIRQVAPGTMLFAAGSLEALGLEQGQTLELRFGDIRRSFTIVGEFKDASRLGDVMIAKADLDYFRTATDTPGMIWSDLGYVTTDDPAALRETLLKIDTVSGTATPDEMEANFIMDMIIAGILLVVSVCLILVAFVMLRFTIRFTLTEEFRQIGVMKAIGIPNRKIRGLYLTKYAFLAALGAAIGLVGSIPFGKMLLRSVSKTMVMEVRGGITANIVCSLAVVAVTVLFCFGCTGKIKKFTPMDAIRSGSAGERFQKKGLLRLNKTPGRPSVFLALNDVLSSPRRFGIVIITFALCLSLVLLLVTSVNTLKSKKLMPAFGLVSSDLYLIRDTQQLLSFFTEDGRQRAEESLAEMESQLAQGGLPGDCAMETMLAVKAVHGDTELKTVALQGLGTRAGDYDYYEGKAPENQHQIAVTAITAKQLGVEIGDTVTLRLPEGDWEVTVTGLFQSMMQGGEGLRLHESLDLSYTELTGLLCYQIDFHDNPSDQEVEERISEVERILGTRDIFTAEEYVEEMAGVAQTLDGLRQLVLWVALAIIAMVTVLMEQSFLTQERSQIALLKALGVPNGSLLLWHGVRFALVALLAAAVSLATLIPLTKLLISPIFAMMGADFGINYDIPALEVYLLYPGLILAVTMAAALLTALRIRSIGGRECAGID